MATRRRDLFLNVRTEGAILPTDLLQRIVEGDSDLGGLTPDAYHLPKGEKLTEATNRAWNRLLGIWTGFRTTADKRPEGDPGTSITRERWLLPLFQELGYGRLLTSKALELAGKSYPISHGWHKTPIHLLGCRVELDRPTQRIAGASRRSPHSLVQELLNRSKEHLWGIVSNGLQLRLLRDNVSLTRQAYVEFDVEAIMEGENYSDFVLLWLVCHQSRVEAENAADCWLEKWSQASKERGVRALDQLRRGVEDAIKALGRGFLAYASNGDLREKLRSGRLDAQDYYRQVLRLVYRLLFLFVAEDRGLLLLPDEAYAPARERYLTYYSTARLRRLAERRSGTRHADLYTALRLVMQRLGAEGGCPELALPSLGSFIFSGQTMPDIETCDLANHDFLDAVRALAITSADGVRRSVDYKNLGAEELGSVYESLLELHPRVNLDTPSFELNVASGHERKTTGSYYTPTSLVDCLLDSALEPVLDETTNRSDPETSILKLKVVDPACGSGHFLIAAAHRIAKRLAASRTGDEEPSPEATRSALRDVIGHCIYGVDVNPMAVELCKVNLWIEALEPGKPLSFLEHRIQCGNALFGTTPALMEAGIPDAAFTPIQGDDREACTKWRKVNKAERSAREKKQQWLGFDGPWMKLGNLAKGLTELDSLADDSIRDVREKERLYAETMRSSDYLDGKFLADAWCSAFVWRKDSLSEFPVTEEVYRLIERNPAAFYHGKRSMADEIQRLSKQYSFLHWHLAFPDVFRWPDKVEEAENTLTGWNGGFDVVLGNPPWERIKLQEKEWFSARRPDITSAPNAAVRRKMISALADEDPALLHEFHEALRAADGESHLLRNSGRYPLCGRGDINTYAVFAETNRTLLSPRGRVGCIVPSGIATDNTTREFFASLINTNTLVSLYDFENAVGLFAGVGHGRFKFCLLTIAGSILPPSQSPDFFFFAHHATDLQEQDRHFRLTAEDIALINPNTRTCPIFRSNRDAEITKAIYRRVPVLIKEGPLEENPWGINFVRMFDMSNDSRLFRTQEQLAAQDFVLQGNIFCRGDEKYLPLYEAKMMHQFTHRYGDYAMHPEGSQDTELPRIPSQKLQDPNYAVLPRYWIEEWEVIRRIADVPRQLLDGFTAKNRKTVSEVFALWLASYHLNRGNTEVGEYVLDRMYGFLSRSVLQALSDRIAAPLLERQYPLAEEDLTVIRANCSDEIQLAEAMIRHRTPKWLLGFRKTARSGDVRTMIATVLPLAAINDKVPLLTTPQKPLLLIGNLGSFALDYVTRQKVGGTDLSHFYVQQLATLQPALYTDSWREFVQARVLELTYTSWDLQPLASAIGYQGPPFQWNETRRFLLTCELDALYFHLYGISRDDTGYIMDTFPIVRRKDERECGEYRTKRMILEIYDAMANAVRMGAAYQTRLAPPPADPRVAHEPAEIFAPPAPPSVVPAQMDIPKLRTVAEGAWAMPTGIRIENLVLLATSEVLHRFGAPVEPRKVWMAVHFVRKPALALAFLDKPEAKDWVRAIGPEAQPVRANVIDISQFQLDASDPVWGEVVASLQATGALITTSGMWSPGTNLPRPSDQEWLYGRAAIAVQLASKLADEEATQRMTEFLRRVEDGTAERAVS